MAVAVCLLSLAWLGCRSPDKGAGKIGPIKKWGVFAGDRVQSTPVVAKDVTVLVGSADKHLYAYSPGGRLEWRLKFDSKVLSPSLASDGTILFSTSQARLIAVSHDGRLMWKKAPRKTLAGCPPAVTSNGYVFASGNLVLVGYKIKDGTPRRLAEKLPPVTSCVVVGPDDTLYFGAKYVLYAWGLDGKKKWSYDFKAKFKYPVFDAKGNLYVGGGGAGKGFLASLTPDGKERWRYNAPKLKTKGLHVSDARWQGFFFPPVISPKDGTIYAVRSCRCESEGIYAITPDGKKKKWLFPHPDDGRAPFYGKLVVAKDGMLYTGAADQSFYAINADGKLHYRFATRGRIFFGAALSADQSTVYIGSEDKHFYALHAHKKAK